jgi:hypothetical protein
MRKMVSVGVICVVLTVAVTCWAPRHGFANSQGSDGYPPLTITIPLGDTLPSATLGFSHPQSDVEIIADVSSRNIRYNDTEVQELLRSQSDLRSILSKEKLGIDIAQFMTNQSLDVGSESLSQRTSTTATLGGYMASAGKVGLESFYNYERGAIDKELVQQLQKHLADIPRNGSLTAGDIRKYFLDHGDVLLGSDVYNKLDEQGASPDEKIAILEDQIDRLVRIVATQGGSHDSPPDSQSVSIPNGPGQSTEDPNVDATFLLFEKRMDASIKAVGAAQDKLSSAVAGMKTTIDRNASQIDGMYRIMYSQLPASEQKKILQESIGAGTPTDYDKQILDGLAARAVFEEQIPAVVANLKALGGIAQNVNLPLEYQQAIARIQRSAELIDSTGQAALQFNPLGVFAGITSLMTDNPPDPEQQRFEFLVKELEDVRKNQITMMKMLADLGSAVAQISDQIDRVDIHLAVVAETSRDGTEVSYGFKDCLFLEGTLGMPNSAYTLPDGSFKSFKSRRDHYTFYRSHFDNCLNALKRAFVVTPDMELSQLFQLDYETDMTGRPLSFEWSDRYRYVLSLIQKYSPAFQGKTGKEQDAILNQVFAASLKSPSLGDWMTMNNKLLHPPPYSPLRPAPDTSAFLPSAKDRYLSVLAVNRYVRFLIEFYPYLIFVSNGNAMRDPGVVIHTAKYTSEHETRALVSGMLVSASRLVNTSVAQQELLDSSLTLPAIRQSIVSWKLNPSSFCGDHNRSFSVVADSVRAAGEKAAMDAFVQDNEDTFALLARRKALRDNWAKYLSIAYSQERANQYREGWHRSFPASTEAETTGAVLDYYFGLEFVQNQLPLVTFGQCAMTINNVLFPHRMDSATASALSNYGTIVLANTGVNLDLPNGSELKQGASNLADHGPEMYVLHSLQRQLLVALTQIHGFDNLSDQQRTLAAYLIAHNQN